MRKHYSFLVSILCLLVFNASSQTPISTFPYLEDFESGNRDWSSSGTNNSWELGVPDDGIIQSSNGCGDSAWVTNLTGNYNNNEESQLESPMFDFTSLTNDPILRFDHIFITEPCCDEGWVEVSSNNGATWTKLGSSSSGGFNWYNDGANDWWDGTSDGWRIASHELTGLAGEDSIRIRFQLDSDGSSVRDGFGVDNVIIFESYNDQSVVSLVQPSDLINPFGSTEDIEISILNAGTNSVTSIELCYSLDNGVPVCETFTTNILANTIDSLTFAVTADLSTIGAHTLEVYVKSANDYTCNDTLSFDLTTTSIVSVFPYIEDFEAGNGDWVATGDALWEHGVPASGAFINSTDGCGNQAWVTNLTGDYGNSQTSYLESSTFDFSGLTNDPAVRFDHIYETEACCDEGWFETSIDGGANWIKLGTASSGIINWYNDATDDWWDGTSGSSNEWRTAAHTLTGFAGESNVKLRFAFSSDGSSVRDGFGVDNIFVFESLNDPLLSEVVFPDPAITTAKFGSTETIELSVINAGTAAITSLNLCYKIDGNAAVCETFTTNIMPLTADTLSFTQTADLSTKGDYALSFYVGSTNDYTCNDSLTLNVTTISCLIPTGLASSNVTSNSALVNWTAEDSETQWEVEWDTAGFTAGMGRNSTVVNTDTFTTLPSLMFTTDYDFYVRAICGMGDTSVSSVSSSFTTGCPPSYAPPYNEDFASFVPNCWDEADAGDPSSGPSSLGSGPWTGSNYLNTSASGERGVRINLYDDFHEDWILSPSFDLSAGGPHELVIDAAVTDYLASGPGDDMGSDDTVQVLISTDGGSSWTALLTWDLNNQPSAEGDDTYRINLDAYSGTDNQFGIWAKDGPVDDAEDYDFHIGNFEVRAIPACDIPTVDGASSIEASEAVLSWTENGFAEQWEVEWDTAGFMAGMARNSEIVDDTFAIALNLRADTDYDYYVRAICPYDDTSAWSTVSSFTTISCGIPTALSTSDVENITAVLSWVENGVATEWVIEWDTAGYTAGTARNEDVAVTDTFISVNGLSSTTDYDFYVRALCGVDTSDFSSVGSFTTLACLPVSGITSSATTGDVDLSWIENSIATQWEVQLDTAGYAAGGARNIEFVNNDTFTNFSALRANVMYDVFIRAICAVGDTSDYSTVYNFTTPPCVDPTSLMADVSSNLAELSWDEAGTASEWQVEWDTAGTTFGTGNRFFTTTDTNNLITGLRAESDYDYYVRAVCGAGDTSAWTAASFTTTGCDSVTDLMSDVYSNVAEVWWTENGTAIEWEIEYDVAGFVVGTGSNSVVVTDTFAVLSNLLENQDYDWYVRAICAVGDTSSWSDTASFRTFSFTPQCAYNLVLEDSRGNGWSGNDLDVTIGSTTTTYTLNSGAEETINLMVNSGDDIRLEYQGGGTFTTQVSFTLLDADNSIVYESGQGPTVGINYDDTARCPSCVVPINLTVASVNVDTAFLNWEESGSATSWIVEWDTAGYMVGTARNSKVVMTDDTTFIDGLGSFVMYDVYVRAICGIGDTSARSFVETFESDFVCPMGAICVGYADGDISTDYDFRELGDTSDCVESLIIPVPSGNRIDSISVVYDMTSSTVTFPWISEQRSWLYSPSSKRGESDVTSGEGDMSGTFSYERTGLTFVNKLIGNVEVQMHAGRAIDFGPIDCNTDYIKVDDGTWNLIAYYSATPACPEPAFLTTDEVIADTNARVSWFDIGSAAEFEIEWDFEGFTAGMGANSMVVSADTFVTLTGLLGFSDYEFFVRAICGVGDTSVWSDAGSFTTFCGPTASDLTATDLTDISAQANWLENGVSTEWIIEWDEAGFTAGDAANSMVVNTDTFTTITGLDASTEYDFYVRAICASEDTSVYSTVGNFTTLCGIPASLNVTDISTDTAVANWTETGIAAEWEIEWDVEGFTVGSGANSDVITANSATMDQLEASTDYDFYVRAICAVGDTSLWSTAESFLSACGPPPSDLYTPIFFDISDVSANVRWTENRTATEWIVEYDAAGFTPGTGSNTVVSTDTFITLTGLDASTTYDYYVRAICGADDTSGYSTKGFFTTLCGIPSGVSGTDGESNQSEISWTETGSATSWEIQYGAPGFTPGTGNSVVADANPFTIDGLNVSTDYEVYVRAICGIGDASLFSAVASFTTGECDSVTNLSSANVSVDTVDLTWIENGTAISWEVSYGPVGFTAGSGTQVAADTNNPFILRGLDPETDYDWYVRAVCNVGENSPWSDTASFSTPACFTPTALSASNISLDSADLAWTENGSATEWEVEYDTAGFTLGTGNKVIVTGTSEFTLKGLQIGTNYDWYVRAICTVDDTSAWSVTGSFVTNPFYYPIGTLNTEDVDGVADSLDVFCWTSGIVIGVDLDGNAGLSFYITDLSSGSQEGINVFNFNDVSNYVVTEGDSIRVRGTIDQFNGLTEIVPDSIEVISTGNAIPAPAFGFNVPGEDTEAKLFELYDLIVVTGSGSGSYNMTAATHNRSDTITIRVDADTDVNDSLDIKPLLPGDTICKIIGIGGQFDRTSPFTGGHQIFPMRFSDIDSSTCINIAVGIEAEVAEASSFELYPNPTDGEFVIKTSGFNNPTVQLLIKDINGRIVTDETINNANNTFQRTFNLQENAKGIYLISIVDGEAVINEKLILH